jgi:alginate O-acetyltransferase complex protein AlgI
MPIGDPRYFLLITPAAVLFYLLPIGRPRVIFLLGVSYIYYLTFPVYFLFFLLLITLIAYLGGLAIRYFDESPVKVWIVACFLVCCSLPMIAFKYVISLLGDATAGGWIFPVGLSFYTFAAVGYLADVSLGILEAETRPLDIALFCAFFPTVTMGPVMRTGILDSFQFNTRMELKRAAHGLSEILIGMVLKIWFADTLAGTADNVYQHLQMTTPVENLVGTVVMLFQIYADWLGYSFIAIGSARLFGLDFPDNFRQPLISSNIGEFWRGWNISLINWLRDYVFTPLQLMFQPVPAIAVSLATIITFSLLGAWHAVGWEYLIYGVINGLLVAGSYLTLSARDRFWKRVGCPLKLVQLVRVPITFAIVVLTIPLVRAGTLNSAGDIYAGIFSRRLIDTAAQSSVLLREDVVIDLLLIAGLIAMDLIAIHRPPRLDQLEIPNVLIIVGCGVAVVVSLFLHRAVQPFVYFQY